MKLVTPLILITLLLILIAYMPLNVAEQPTQPQPVTIQVNWAVTGQLKDSKAIATATCIAKYVYILTIEDQNSSTIIALDPRTGQTVKIWHVDGEILCDCAVYRGKIYAAGSTIRVFDQDLNPLMGKDMPSDILAGVIAAGESAIYTLVYSATDKTYTLEKRDPQTLEILAAYRVRTTNGASPFMDVAGGFVWLTYLKGDQASSPVVVEVLDQNLNLVKKIETELTGTPGQISASHDEAYLIVGQKLVKISLTGYVESVSLHYPPQKVLKVGNTIYIAYYAYAGNYNKHVLKAFDQNLNPAAEKILNPNTSGDSYFTNLGKMATDGQNLYLVGYLDKGPTREWITYSIQLQKKQPKPQQPEEQPKQEQPAQAKLYYLRVEPPQLTNGTGWYELGTTVIVAAKPLAEAGDTRLVFTGWSDGEKDPIRQITVKSNLTLHANYKTQYLVTVESPYGTPKGAGWYDAGTTATISIQTFILGFPSAKELTAWIVDGKTLPPSQTLTIAVNGPLKVKAKWRDNYIPLMVLFVSIILVAVVAFAFKKLKRESN